MKQLFLFFLLLPFCLSAQNNRLYVKTNAIGTNDGSSWTNAFAQLTTALQVAESGDTVWVAEGTYLPADNRDSSFHPSSGVRLYGGFTGTENTLEQRDWVNHPCILSGDVGVAGDSTDNSYTIMYLLNPDSLTVVDGFVFRYGMATYTGSDGPSNQPRRSGGALYIMGADEEAYATIRHCRFEHNHARSLGGAVYINGSGDGSVAPQFLNCVFAENSAGTDGGAVYRNGSSWVERVPDFGHCLFEKNRAGRNGGGLFFQDAERTDTLQLANCDFLSNRATVSGGGLRFVLGRSGGSLVAFTGGNYAYNIGSTSAAMHLIALSAIQSILLDDLHIHDNGYLTGIFSENIIRCEGTSNSNSANLTLSNIIFDNNRAKNGIIEGLHDFSTTIVKSNFYSNNFVDLLISGDSRLLLIQNSICKEKNVVDNLISRTSDGNDLIIRNSLLQNKIAEGSSNSYSQCIFNLKNISIDMINCTIESRKLFFNENYTNVDSINIQIENSILSNAQTFLEGNGPNGIANVFLTNSALFNTSFDCATLPPGTCGANVLIGVDPLFVQPDSGDYRLQPCSPLIGAGDNAFVSPDNQTDLDGNPRIIGMQVDMGAYEHTGPRLAAPPEVTPTCATGTSGAVDFQLINGCLPYTYAWTGMSGSSGVLPGNLAPDDYTFTITDARGANFTVNVTVPATASIQLTPLAMPVVCAASLGGTASVQVLNGMGPYSYLWAGGSMDSVRTDLAAGFYPVTVTDAQGCSASGMVQVSSTGGLLLDIQVDPISCPGAADGGFVVLPANGQEPFAWQWENGPASPAYGPLGPGTYRGMLTDAYNCKINWILPLNEPQAIAFDTLLTQASGFSVADGSAMVTNVTGGNPPFSVLWSNGATGFSAPNLLPDDYTVTVTDANGCEQVQAFIISYTSAVQAAVENPVRIFPNPANDMLWLEMPVEAGLSKIILTNALGQLVWQGQSEQVRSMISLSGQSTGIYTLQIITAQGAHYQAKVVVQH